MRKILLISSFIFCTFLSAAVPIIKAQTYSSSAPVVATPIATPLIILATPVVISVATPIATSSAVKTPVTGTADYTYLFLLVGFSACIFALYRLKCRK